MNRKRKSSSKGHPVMDGMASIRRTAASANYWQFSMWIPEEGTTYRKSLRTTDFESAMEAARSLCIELHHKVKSGKKLFGVTLAELVATFLEYKGSEVGPGGITAERLSSIKTYLKPLLRFKGENTFVGELDRKAAFDYAKWRRGDKATVKDVTIRNEQATINMMIGYAFREGYINFAKFEFAKLRIAEVGRRDTFTEQEYRKLYGQLQVWSNACDKSERAERMMIRDCILFAAHSMLRVGEFRQLRWKDIQSFTTEKDDAKRDVILVQLKVRKETSKTRKSRTITTRGGQFLKRLRDRTPNWQPEDYVFCGASGSERLSERKCNTAWAELMAAIGVDYRSRNLTWYSLRHYAITRRLAVGVPIFLVASIAGTSATYIQAHYGHVDQSMARSAALKALRKD